MTIEEAIDYLTALLEKGGITVNETMALGMAIKSLEAWEKIKKEIDDSILICQESAQNNTWCDGELAGFLQSKDIIFSEVSE